MTPGAGGVRHAVAFHLALRQPGDPRTQRRSLRVEPGLEVLQAKPHPVKGHDRGLVALSFSALRYAHVAFSPPSRHDGNVGAVTPRWTKNGGSHLRGPGQHGAFVPGRCPSPPMATPTLVVSSYTIRRHFRHHRLPESQLIQKSAAPQ